MARPALPDRIRTLHAQWQAQDRCATRRVVSRRDGVRLEVDGRWLTSFAGSDYLGLAQQFEVVNALQDAAAREGVGASASQLCCGHHALHQSLERDVADWLEAPRALLFDSRYAANLAVQQALLCEDDDVCVQDSANHSSLFDATRLAGARLRRYPHLDGEGAMRQLRHAPKGAAMLVTEGMFGADGDMAPLRALSLLARLQEAVLYVDDAHAAGLVGEQGRGSVHAAGLGVADVPLRLIALDKALGGHGALVVGDADLVDHLAETAAPFVHGMALPPALAAASLEAFRLARRDDWRREKLAERVADFRGAARRHGLELMASESAIQPLPCTDAAHARAWALALEQAGWLVDARMGGSAADGRPRLRISLSALHTPEQVRALVDAIAFARDGLLDGVLPTVAVPA